MLLSFLGYISEQNSQLCFSLNPAVTIIENYSLELQNDTCVYLSHASQLQLTGHSHECH